MNINKAQPSIRSYGTPSVFTGTNLLTYSDGTWKINGEAVTGGPTPETEARLKHGATADVFEYNLQLINERINTLKKSLTYWDLYHITAQVNDSVDFAGAYNALQVGESLVINKEEENVNGVIFHRGDVLVKIDESNSIHIPSLSTGVYRPASLSLVNNNFIITYEYSPNLPEEGATMQLTASGSVEAPDVAYNVFESFGSQYTDDLIFAGSSRISPVIKFYMPLESEGAFEEVSDPEVEIEIGASTYTVSRPEIDLPLYIQVK